MKLSQQQATALLKKLVPTVELVEQDNPDFNPDTVIDSFLGEREPVFRKKFTDEEVPKLTSQIAGQIGAKVRTAIKKLSKGQIKDADLKDLQDDEAMQLLLDRMVDLSGKDTEALRKQLEKLVEDNNKAMEELKNDYEGKLNSERSKVTDQLSQDYLVSLHSKFPLLKGNDVERARALRILAGAQYKVVYNNEKKIAELRDMSNPESPVIKDGKVYTFEQFAEDHYKNNGLWQIDARHQRDQNPKPALDPKDTKGKPSQLSDLEAAIAAVDNDL